MPGADLQLHRLPLVLNGAVPEPENDDRPQAIGLLMEEERVAAVRARGIAGLWLLLI